MLTSPYAPRVQPSDGQASPSVLAPASDAVAALRAEAAPGQGQPGAP